MANTLQAKKRVRQTEKSRLQNTGRRSRMRTAIKNVRLAIEAKDLKTANETFRKAVSIIDRAAQSKLIHQNTAARYKRQLNQKIKTLVK